MGGTPVCVAGANKHGGVDMKFFAQLTDNKTIHTNADRLEVDRDNNMLLAFNGDSLVAVVDLSAVMFAHIAERKESL